ncbi:hypothetical protein AB0940_31930 [Streptomyces sp. NPDC006656]|uniref:hypothetical protein n=1 Tax=Streptomyces sp. NPDC006656 TaxID=3156899 RepID=UPI0034511ADC
MARLRTVAPAAAFALSLLCATPGPASAASGDFSYTYKDKTNGRTATVDVEHPVGGKCTNVPEVANGRADSAYAPSNQSDREVQVYTGLNCAGSKYVLGKNTSQPRLSFASWKFKS